MCEDEADELMLDGSRLTPLAVPEFNATFQLFVNKQLVYTNIITNDQPFRLPTGYRSDTFEVRVATTARVRAIHLAETVSGLRGA
jgi:hypothetical protein